MNIENFIQENWKTILIAFIPAALVYIFKKSIQQIFHWLKEFLLWLIGLFGVHVLLLRRFKQSLIKEYQKTKIGYRTYRIDLQHNYITLRLAGEEFIRAADRDTISLNKSKGVDAIEFLLNKTNKHTIILGHPGSGKTTLLQHLLLRYACNFKNANHIPIFIPLRELDDRAFLDYIAHFVKMHKFTRFGYIKRQLKRGKCLVMFDGLDEVSEIEKRRGVMQRINEFSTEFSGNHILVTSRIEGFSHNVLNPSFHEHEILDLDADQRKNFIKGILPADKNPDRLIRQIEEQRGLQRLAVRPLTLALLTFIYQETKSLPKSRIRIYETCIDLMLEDRDEVRGLLEYRNKYDSDLKKQILRKISFDFLQEGKQSFDINDLKNKITESIQAAGLTQIDVTGLIKELAESNGIFRRKTKYEYDFAHLTFQEFFAAKELYVLPEIEREQLLTEKMKLDSWREVFLFYSQLCDSPGKLVEEALKLDNIMLAADLAICALNRLPKQLHLKILTQLIDREPREKRKLPDVNRLDMICELASGSFEVFAYERINKIYSKEQSAVPELMEINKRFNLIGRENIDGKHPAMLYIPAGAFLYQDQKLINLPGFWIGRYPVINREFKEFVDAIGLSKFNDKFQEDWKGKNSEMYGWHPVIYITWFEAAQYCNWLSQKHGFDPAYDEKAKDFLADKNGFRLPTEQEWEKTASWDDFTKKKSEYPWGSDFDANRCNNSVKRKSSGTSDVRKYDNGKSFYGCNDMAGNVWEWTASWYNEEKKIRVLRGGSWGSNRSYYFRCADRGDYLPGFRGNYFGFRVVCSAQF